MFTSVVNKFFFVKELEKKKKRNLEVIDRGDDENGDVKTKDKWFVVKKIKQR